MNDLFDITIYSVIALISGFIIAQKFRK